MGWPVPIGSPDSAHPDTQGQTQTGIRMGHSAEGVPEGIWLGRINASHDPNLQHVLKAIRTLKTPGTPSQGNLGEVPRRDEALSTSTKPPGRPSIRGGTLSLSEVFGCPREPRSPGAAAVAWKDVPRQRPLISQSGGLGCPATRCEFEQWEGGKAP